MWSSLRQIVFLDLDYNYYIWLLDDWLKSSSRNNVLFIAVLKIHFLAVSDVSVTLFVFVFSLYHTSPGDIVVPEYIFKTTLIWSKGGSLGAQRGTVWADGTCQLQWRRTEKSLVLFTIRFSLWPPLPLCAITPIFNCSGKFLKMRIQNSLNLQLQSESMFPQNVKQTSRQTVEILFFFFCLFK